MKISTLITLFLTTASIISAETTTQLTSTYIQCQYRMNCSVSPDRNQCANACLHEVHRGVVEVEKMTGSNNFPLAPPPPQNSEAELSKLLILMMLANQDEGESKPIIYPTTPVLPPNEPLRADDSSS